MAQVLQDDYIYDVRSKGYYSMFLARVDQLIDGGLTSETAIVAWWIADMNVTSWYGVIFVYAHREWRRRARACRS